MTSLADLYRDISEIDLALKHYKEALILQKDDRILTKIGILYFELCQFKKAEEFYYLAFKF